MVKKEDKTCQIPHRSEYHFSIEYLNAFFKLSVLTFWVDSLLRNKKETQL